MIPTKTKEELERLASWVKKDSRICPHCGKSQKELYCIECFKDPYVHAATYVTQEQINHAASIETTKACIDLIEGKKTKRRKYNP